MRPHPNYPFAEIETACRRQIAQGHIILQKFTCGKCGERLTMSRANTLHTHGHCPPCDHVTDIRASGCNYSLIQSSRPLEDVVAAGIVEEPLGPGLTIWDSSTHAGAKP